MRILRRALLLAIGVAVGLPVQAQAWGPPPGSVTTQPHHHRTRNTPARPARKLTAKQARIERAYRFANYLAVMEKDYAGAAREFKKVLRLDRKHYRATTGLASALMRAKEWARAAKALKAAIKLSPKERGTWHTLGKVMLKKGNHAKALVAFERAVALDGGFAPALLDAGDLLYSRSRTASDSKVLERAVSFYERYLLATRMRKGQNAHRIERIVAELRQGPVAAAFLDARQMYDAAFTTRKRMHLKLEQAYAKLSGVLAKSPKYAPALYYQGLIHLSVKSKTLHNTEKGLAQLRAAGEYAPALTELGRFLRTEDRLEEAAKALTRATRADAKHQAAWHQLAIVRNLDGARSEAVLALRKAVDLDPASAIAAKAIIDLSKLAPADPRVSAHVRRAGRFKGDVFNTEKFKGSIRHLEARLGGIDENAPEQAWLDTMMRRLLKAGDHSPELFRVLVAKTKTVNAFAVPNGNIYFTRGFLRFIAKAYPNLEQNENHGPIAAVMGHEITHVTKEHVIRSFVFKDAMNTGRYTPSSLVSVTRTHEIEADREGMRLMFLAGYHPRDAVDLHASYARVLGEIPRGLDHPTFDERIHYLEDYWSNEMAFAYASFSQGVSRIKDATRLEAVDINKAATLYRESIDDLRRFTVAFGRTKEALNNLALSYAKLGLFELAKSRPDTAIARWYTEFSIEREVALKFVPLSRRTATRSADGGKDAPLPAAMRQAKAYLTQALRMDPKYARAYLNLGVVLLASGDVGGAEASLRAALRDCGKDCPVKKDQVANLMGIVRAEQGKLDDAVRSFEVSIKEQPSGRQLPPRIFNLARALDKADRRSDAIDAYQRFLSTVGDQDTGGWATRARAALKKLKD